MSRSVVLAGTERCDGCLLPPRWCVCPALPAVESPLQVHVLLHRREQWRPTSTGKLIGRAVAGSRLHVFHRTLPRESVLGNAGPAAEPPWILHPRGEPLGERVARSGLPEAPTVLLLDGSWAETGRMLQHVQEWGVPVRLPLADDSRYWLRGQKDDGELSTAEALMGLYAAVGLPDAAERLRLHLELHVYAGLRARGRKAEAAAYLARSPIRDALGPFLDRLQERRPNLATSPPVRPPTLPVARPRSAPTNEDPTGSG